MQKVKIEWHYLIIFLGMIIIAVMAFFAGRVMEQEQGCASSIEVINEVISECNEKIRECNHLNNEFNLTNFLTENNLTWKIMNRTS